jgi:lipopolysaccharide transport system ATP-binding protein
MSNIAIKVENLSKIYRLGEIGTGSIGQDVDRWFKTKILGKEDPFLKIGESNDRATKGSSDIVYSLQDINFEINQGDAVGIIGRNGAGKSTLLKILSRVTTPTTGKINIKGRVASLLEVGTGFHPELTGRENIYLNGAILGMRKREIDRKLDEIIDFSGVERYIDTPVKRYSSGMYVRLAFAVAAHLESEILIVDEVLAVGDAEFQKKCLGKMGEVSKGDGRTVLFVSHNMHAIKKLCNNAMLLQNGKLVENSKTEIVIQNYLQNQTKHINNSKSWELNESPGDDKVKLLQATLINDNTCLTSEKIIFEFKIQVLQDNIRFICGCILTNVEEIEVFHSHDVQSDLEQKEYSKGIYLVNCNIPGNLLNEGKYKLTIACFTNNTQFIHFFEDVVDFEVIDSPHEFTLKGNYLDIFPGIVRPELKWHTQLIQS